MNGYAGPIALQMPELPAGITGELAPLTVQAGQFSTLTLTTATPLAPQSHTWTITGSATMQNRTVTHDTSVTLTIIGSGHNFTLGATSTEATVTAGQAANYTITSTGLGGFTGPISLNVEGLPGGATFAFGQPSITAGSSTSLLVTTPADLEAGTYPLTVTGTANIDAQPVTKSLTLMLTVEADTPEEPGDPTDFSLTTTQNTSVVVPPGGEGTITVISLPSGQFLSPIDLTAAGFPQGVTAQFEPSRIGPNGSSTLTLQAAASVPSGKYSFTITGTAQVEAQTLTHQVQLLFVVAGTETTTTITGVVMTAEDTPQPLAGVAVFQAQNPVNRVMTDDQGQFTLTNLPPDAHQSLIIDGSVLPMIPTTVSYPAVPLGFDVIPNTVHQVEGIIYLPQLHLEDQVPIEQNSPNEQILTNSRIPNLQVIIPPRTRVLNYDKTPLTHVWITKVRGDRMPFARPSGIDLSVVPEVYTIQPQSAALDNQFEIRFPNNRGAAPGEEFLFWRDNQETSSLRIWGRGKVTPDRLQIVRNAPLQPPGSSVKARQRQENAHAHPKANEIPVDFRFRDIFGWFYNLYPCEGTAPPPPDAPHLIEFKIDPNQLDLYQGQTASLKAIGKYSDGTERDLTHLCSFETNTFDQKYISVTRFGTITAKYLDCQDCAGAIGVSVLAKLEVGIYGTELDCVGSNGGSLLRFVPIRIPLKGLQYRFESDYTPIIQIYDVGYILNGHPTTLKISSLPGNGGIPVVIYAPGEELSSDPNCYRDCVGPVRKVYDGVIGEQEISIPLPDYLFHPQLHSLRLIAYERGGDECSVLSSISVVKVPNLTITVTPNKLPILDPEPSNPSNLVTVNTDALIQVQSDLPIDPSIGVSFFSGGLYLLKNGRFDYEAYTNEENNYHFISMGKLILKKV